MAWWRSRPPAPPAGSGSSIVCGPGCSTPPSVTPRLTTRCGAWSSTCSGRSDPDLANPPVIPALAEAIDELANVDALLSQVEAAHRTSDQVALAVAAADTWQEDGQWSSGARRLEAAVAASADLDPLTRAGAVRALGCRHRHLRRRAAADPRAGGRREDGPRRRRCAARRRTCGSSSPTPTATRGTRQRRCSRRRGLRELARVVDSEYVDLGVQSLDGAGRLMAGDHEGSRRTLDRVAERLEVLGALSDAARIHRMSSLASRAAGDLDAGARVAATTPSGSPPPPWRAARSRR